LKCPFCFVLVLFSPYACQQADHRP
jgi:hypothetical protein